VLHPTIGHVSSRSWEHCAADAACLCEALRQTTKEISSPPIDGVVLRYGHLYGPGTGTNTAEAPALHVDAAASAAVLAIEKARRGIYYIAERADTSQPRKHDASVRLNAARDSAVAELFAALRNVRFWLKRIFQSL
jgi:hypothetical protein